MSPGLVPANPPHPDDHEPDDHESDDHESEPRTTGLDPIPLPDLRWHERVRRRRRERQRRRRRRLWQAGLVFSFIAMATTVIALLVGPVARLARDREAKEAANTARGQVPAPPPTPDLLPMLLVHQDGLGRASSLTVLVPAVSGKGGSLLLIPPGTMTEVVPAGLEPVRQSLEQGGPARVQATVENLLGATLAGVVVLDDAGVTNLLGPSGPLSVRLPEPVEQRGQGGRVEVLYEAGPLTLAPGRVGRFLAAKGRDGDLARLTRHRAFWDAWLARLRERPSAVPSRSPLSPALAALAAGPVETHLVPVESFGSAGDGGELYKARGEELARLVAGVFPAAARQGLAERPRVQVLNGTGDVELVEAVRAKLGAGFDVRLTGNADRFDYERTEIVFYEPDQEAVADRLRRALGVGTLVLSRRPLDVVDVTAIVGKDFHP